MSFLYPTKVLSLLLTTFLIGCSSVVKTDPNGIQTNNEKAMKAPYVIMISIDGFRHDYIKKYRPPFLSSVVKKGIQAKSLTSIFPSKTFPNHYALVTGLYAENHGLVANRFYDPETGEDYQLGNSKVTTDGKWYGGSPLWLSVRDQGMLSSSFFWVGSDANINGHYPNYYVPYDGSIKNRKRVEQTLEWLKLPEEKRPHYLTLYFSDVDSAGHRYGPDSEQVKEAIYRVDAEIAFLAEKAKELKLPINYVIVSDHGMKAIDNDRKVYLRDYINIDKARFKERGPITLIYMKDKKDLKSYKKSLKKVPHTKIYERHELPKRFHYSKNPRSGDLILLADPGAYIYPQRVKPKKGKHKGKGHYSGGTHGYDPSPKVTPDMGGIFLSFGPNVRRKGFIETFENIHVYPYVMSLLGLEVKKKIDGKKEVLLRYIKN